MKQKTPSFLLNRNGVYYFHFRIPKHVKHLHGDKAFIRQSLKTSNRIEALKKARLKWFEVMSDKIQIYDAIDEEDSSYGRLYRRGKELHSMLAELDPNDPDALDDFWIHQFDASTKGKASFDKQAFECYQTHIETEENKVKTAPRKEEKITEQSYKLSKLVEIYIKNKSKGWSNNTSKDYIPILRNIVELMKDPYIKDLNFTLIEKRFSNVIEKLPTHVSKKREYIDENGEKYDLLTCIKIAEEHKLEIISYRTLGKYVALFKALLAFGIKRYDVDKKSELGLEFFDLIDHDPILKDGNYTSEELKTIFYHPDLNSEKQMYQYPERFWVTLLALYTGARVNEIAQTKMKEVLESDQSFWYIDMLDEERTKRLKNKQSRRLIPLHPHLIELGFLEYLIYQKSINSEFLFSRLSKPDSLDRYYRKFTNWWYKFSKALQDENLLSVDRKFHDFRNTAINKEKQDHLNENVMREVFGHSQKHDAHSGYQNTYELTTKYDEVCKLDFDLDLFKIKKWSRIK